MMDSTNNLFGGHQPTLERIANRDGPDFFPTPAWATSALIDIEIFEGDIWECACGDGSMPKVLEATRLNPISTDSYDRGFGESNIITRILAGSPRCHVVCISPHPPDGRGGE